MLKGKIASKGIAIAKAFNFEKEELVIGNSECSNIDVCLAQLDEAIAKSDAELQHIIENSLGHKDIFEAHLQLLHDIELIEQTQQLIKSSRKNTALAYKEISDQFIAMFEAFDDPYFKERALDVKDIQYRVLCHVLGIKMVDLSSIDTDVVIIAKDLTPSDTASLNLKYVKGFITALGGLTSHTAIMARSLNIPAIVGVSDLLASVHHDDLMILDALTNTIITNPSQSQLDQAKNDLDKHEQELELLKVFKDKKTETKDHHHVGLYANIGSTKDIQSIIDFGSEGVGLFRTEFLFMDSQEMPTLDTQIDNYKKVFESISPVIVRTLDIGGDKELPYLKQQKEENPFLGHRAIRLCFEEVAMFKTQLKAILIAGKEQDDVRIMIPMIARVDEVLKTKEILSEVINELDASKIKHQKNIKLGIMIEIPSAALNVQTLAKYVDFISIGSNDLIQYLYAADRMNDKVGYLYEPYDPTLLRVVKSVISEANKANIESGLCGEIGSNPHIALLLTGMGIDEISMSASSILEIRELLSKVNYTELVALVDEVISYEFASEVKNRLEQFVKENI